jgi:hypothetical protein
MQFAANVVQLVGAVVTLLGLWYAYTRSAHDGSPWVWLWSKVRRSNPRVQTGAAQPSLYSFGTLSAEGYAPFTLDTAQPIEDQLTQLADYARSLRSLFSPVFQDIARLDRDIKAAHEHAASVASQALTDATQHLEEFKADQTRAEVLDLRVAIWGLAITAAGLVLAFWA